MNVVNEYMQIINDCISMLNREEKLPIITYNQLCADEALIEKCIDYVGDMLCMKGFDADYSLTEYGEKLEDAIDFLNNMVK